jgi:ERCC4-type nuclease
MFTQEIILNQIPGISQATSLSVMKHFGSLYNLLDCLKTDPKCFITDKDVA